MSDAPAGMVGSRRRNLRNTLTFGPGTFGRDMVYTLINMYLVYYLTEVVRPGDAVIGALVGLLFAVRLLDAFLDFVMGAVVDNTRTRWGSYKPWILAGSLASAVFTLLLFTDLRVTGAAFVAAFTAVYLLWGVSWTMNDIPYWSLLPALTTDQRGRERMGAVAKVCGTLGLFVVAIGILPATHRATATLGSGRAAWFWVVAVLVVVMVAFQCITLVGVRQPAGTRAPAERLSLKGVGRALLRNDQLLWSALCMTLFAVGNTITTTFGTYFFKYAYRDESAYPVFAAVIGVANLLGYVTFPLLTRAMTRRSLYTLAIATMLLGYVGFWFCPMQLAPLLACGLLIYLALAWLVMLMLVLLTDTIEYGQWKTGTRSTAATFALQPFIWKVAAAAGQGVALLTAVLSGISHARTPADVTAPGLLLLKVAMIAVPAVLIAVSYLIYRRKYVIDTALYERIVAELRERGELG